MKEYIKLKSDNEMNQLIHSLEIISNKCNVYRNDHNDEIGSIRSFERKKRKIHQLINEIHYLMKKKKSLQRKHQLLQLTYVNIELRSKKKEVFDLYNQMKSSFIHQNVEVFHSDDFFQIERILNENLMKIKRNESKQMKIKRNRTNSSFYINHLEEYNRNQINTDIKDNRINTIVHNDNHINHQLNTLEHNVSTLKYVTQNIHQQLDNQDILLDVTKDKMMKNNDKFSSQSIRFRDLILQLYSPQNCCVTFLLCICIFGLLSIIAFLVLNSF